MTTLPHPAHLDLIPTWKLYMEQGILNGRPFSMATIQTYSYYVEWLLKEHGELTSTTLKTVLLGIAANHFAKRQKLFVACQSFARFLQLEGFMTADFAKETKHLKPKRHLPPKKTVVNEAEVDALTAACKTTEECLIVNLLSNTGLRPSEACALQMKDIDLENKRLTVRLAKWGKTRQVGLSSIAIAALAIFLEDNTRTCPEDFLLLNSKGKPMDRHGLYQRLERVGKLAGVKVNPHALRRSFVTVNANKGRPLPMLQMACGHSDIATTRSYCMTTENEVIEAMKDW